MRLTARRRRKIELQSMSLVTTHKLIVFEKIQTLWQLGGLSAILGGLEPPLAHAWRRH